MTIDEEMHDTVGDILADAARHTSHRSLAAIAWSAGALALAIWLAGRPSWIVWSACYAAWVFATWGMLFGSDAARRPPRAWRLLEIALVTTGTLAAGLLGVLVFYAVLGPRWVL